MVNERYRLRCQGCNTIFPSGEWILHCPSCKRSALLISEYHSPLSFEELSNEFVSYARLLPYEDSLAIKGPTMAAVQSRELGSALGLKDLWLLASGWAPSLGSDFLTGTFKDCEALGVLNRVKEQTSKLLIVASAGNAGRAFLEIGLCHSLPAIVVMPEKAKTRVSYRADTNNVPLVLLVRDGEYPDAIRIVDSIIERYSDRLVREGGCYNVARRDAMGIPFLNAVRQMQCLPDWYVQAVGSGTGAIAAWEAAGRIRSAKLVDDARMRLLLVQNEPFAPMVDAWRSGRTEISPMTSQDVRNRLEKVRAKVLSNATPPYSVRGGVYDILTASEGSMCSVTNEQVIAAQNLAQELLGVEICDASSAALAGLIKSRHENLVGENDKVLLHLTGIGLGDIRNNRLQFEYPNSTTIPLDGVREACAAVESYLDQNLVF